MKGYVSTMILLIAISAFILLISFSASSMEAALFSVTPLRVEQLLKQRLRGAERLKMNKDNIQDSIIALVFINNLANVAGSVLVGAIAAEVFSHFWIGIFTGFLTFAIIFFGEIIPKMIGERYADSYGRYTSGTVFAIRILFKPFIVMTRLFIRPLGGATPADTIFSEDEINMLAHLGHRDGAILEFEKQLIHHVFQLNDTLAKDIMTPRTVVFALPANAALRDVSHMLYSASVSRIPVYEEDLDHIVGIVHIRDLLAALAKDQSERSVGEFMSEASFIPDTAKADVLLKSFQKNREHIAIVIDEHGGMAGVITLEDVLEQLVGEIVDEYDSDVDLRLKARTLGEQQKISR
jgi:CBS domain containing-hemolysin-like protein